MQICLLVLAGILQSAVNVTGEIQLTDSKQQYLLILTFLFNSSLSVIWAPVKHAGACGACGACGFAQDEISQDNLPSCSTCLAANILYIDHAGRVREVVLMHHRTALSAMCSLRSGY